MEPNRIECREFVVLRRFDGKYEVQIGDTLEFMFRPRSDFHGKSPYRLNEILFDTADAAVEFGKQLAVGISEAYAFREYSAASVRAVTKLISDEVQRRY